MVAMVHGVATVVVAAVRNSGGLGVAVVEVAASECGDGCGPCGRRGQRPRGGCSEQREGAGAGRRLGARGWSAPGEEQQGTTEPEEQATAEQQRRRRNGHDREENREKRKKREEMM
jgi:hypothetical protein